MHSKNLSDFDLVTRVLGGEKELFRLLMERHHTLVFHVAQRFMPDPEQMAETAHEIFVKVYEQLESFENRSAFSSWVYGLARNHCIDKKRWENRHNRHYMELPHDHSRHLESTEPGPDEFPDNSLNRLWKAIGRMGEHQSVPLLMKYRDGMSYQAISEALDVPVGALKVRVHRARKELKQFLEQKI
ncbi:RNA polymerase sigma factor [Balneolales bacterium ANBcel1]|nr:RNA polymerase sigma factor [Balneolales bacterium ANBcel1]